MTKDEKSAREAARETAAAAQRDGIGWGEFARRLDPPPVAVDFHYGRNHGLPFYELMYQVEEQALAALHEARSKGVPWVVYTHGSSTSRPGRTTARSTIRAMLRRPDVTPLIFRPQIVAYKSVTFVPVRPLADH